MSFPTMNALLANTVLTGKVVSTASDTVSADLVIATSALGYGLFRVPAPVDVSGMEFGISVLQAGGTAVAQGIASGASTVEIQFSDLATGGTNVGSTNQLVSADDFSNTVTGGWTSGQVRKAVGTSATDLDADDIVGIHMVANLTGAAGIGNAGVYVGYIYGIPAVIN